jgi:hypothetical protein
MAKRSTRRMRGGFWTEVFAKLSSPFTAKKPEAPTSPTSPTSPTNPTNKGPSVVVVNPQRVGEQVNPGATPLVNYGGEEKVPPAFGGARRRRSTRRKARTIRRKARKASRKARRSASRKSRRASRKH